MMAGALAVRCSSLTTILTLNIINLNREKEAPAGSAHGAPQARGP